VYEIEGDFAAKVEAKFIEMIEAAAAPKGRNSSAQGNALG